MCEVPKAPREQAQLVRGGSQPLAASISADPGLDVYQALLVGVGRIGAGAVGLLVLDGVVPAVLAPAS